MRDYLRQVTDTLTKEGDDAAFDMCQTMLSEIEADRKHLDLQEKALLAIGGVLYERQSGPTSPSEVEDDPEEPVEPPPEYDPIEAAERPRLIVEAADAVWSDQQDTWGGSERDQVQAKDVLANLRGRGLDLGVMQPFAVIGTVLASSDGYRKIARNTFVRVHEPAPDPVDDLPW